MFGRKVLAGTVFVACAALIGCGGGGGSNGGPPPVQATATPTPTPVATAPPAAASSSATVSSGNTAQIATMATIATGYASSVTLPGSTGGVASSIKMQLSSTLPGATTPTLASAKRSPKSIGVTLTPLAYISVVAVT